MKNKAAAAALCLGALLLTNIVSYADSNRAGYVFYSGTEAQPAGPGSISGPEAAAGPGSAGTLVIENGTDGSGQISSVNSPEGTAVADPTGTGPLETLSPQDLLAAQASAADGNPVMTANSTAIGLEELKKKGIEAWNSLSGDGSVKPDPVLGLVPDVHMQVLKTDGNLTDGFTTNMGMFNSPDDGICGLKLRLENGVGDVFYRIYTDEHGWSEWAMNEMITPYVGDQARVCAIQMRLNGYTDNLYSFYYRVALNDGTFLGWARDGQTAGALGTGLYIQQVEIRLYKRGAAFPDSTQGRLAAAAEEGIVFNEDGQASYSTFDGRAFTGWAYDTDGNKYYFQDNSPVTGWQYIEKLKYYFDEKGRVVTDLEPVIGLPGSYAIQINREMKCLTVYTKDGKNGFTVPYKVFLVTIGPNTPLGSYKTYESHRWKFMHDDIYCQYLLRFKDGFLLHSIIYMGEPESHHLVASTFNQLGKNQSDGCVRLLSGDAAWLYTNCGTGTSVKIYKDEWKMGPFDRPAIEWAIPENQNYDPSDPVIIEEQKSSLAAASAGAGNTDAAPETQVTQITMP